MTSTTITVRISDAEKEKLDRLSSHTSRTRSFLAGKAIADYVDRELEVIEGIERGLEDAAAGRVVPHADAMKRLRAAASKRG